MAAPPGTPAARLRIGVDVNPLRPPYTGVGNYELWLLDALLALEADLALDGFGRFGWCAVDADFIAARMGGGSKAGAGPSPVHPAPQSASRRIVGAMERAARGSSLARASIAALRGSTYARSAGTRRLDAFHAFMYRAPARVEAVPVIPVIYDLSHVRHPEFHPAGRLRWMEGVAEECQRAPLVHTISAFTAREIVSVWGVPRERIHVVPPAVSDVFRDPAKADPGVLARLGLRAGGYALTVSTLEPRKNLSTLLDAYGRLPAAERERLPLVVSGAPGWGGVRLEDHPLVRSGAVRLAGYVSDRELAALYRGARIMLYPSIYEGYGMPVIEALAVGAPVVASDAASMPEALAGHGRLVDPHDVPGWTESLREALADDSLQTEDRRAARSAHATAWRWHDAAERVLAMYRAIAGS